MVINIAGHKQSQAVLAFQEVAKKQRGDFRTLHQKQTQNTYPFASHSRNFMATNSSP